jgi:hypothetical protein
MRALTIPVLITRHGYRACHFVNFVLALRMKFPTECNDYRMWAISGRQSAVLRGAECCKARTGGARMQKRTISIFLSLSQLSRLFARNVDNRLPCGVIMCSFDRAQMTSSRSDVCWRDFSSGKTLGEGHRNGI